MTPRTATWRLIVVLASMAIHLAVVRRASADSSMLPSPLHASDVLAYAHAHRAELRAAKAQSAALAEQPKVVSALPDPMVMGSIDHLPFKMAGVGDINWSLMVQQDFPLSGILGARKRAAEAEAAAAQSNEARVGLDVELDALNAFLMRIEVDRMKVINDEQCTLARQTVAVARARLVGGDVSAADILRAESDLARLVGERDALVAQLVGVSAMLNAALARPVEALLPPLEMGLPSADPAPVPTLVAMALEKRPELASMKATSNAASANVDVMRAMYTPMAFVRFGTAYTMEGGQGAMLMLGISIPIWREKLDAGVTEAKSMVLMVDAETDAMKKMIEGEVGVARAAVVAARVRHAALRDSVVPLARKAVTLMIANYAGGQTSLVAVLDATRALRETSMEEVQAEIAVGRAWAKLSRATGAVKLGAP